jgi:hypothetical protein
LRLREVQDAQPTEDPIMFRTLSRRAGQALALMLPALVACVDEPSPTAPTLPAKPNFGVGAVVTVTNTSGGTETGSVRWAVGSAGDQGVIAFAPAIAGATITLDSTLHVSRFLYFEGPKERGITLSGGGKVRVMQVDQGAWISNLNIANGADSVWGAGILATGGELTVLNTAVFDNKAPNAAGVYVDGTATFTNSTVARNIASGIGSGISYSNRSNISLINVTVNGNGPAPGIASHYRGDYTPVVTLQNSIIAGNGNQNCYTLFGFVYQGRNISDDTSCGDASKLMIADPKLGVVADNGGPSATIAIQRQSPAYNAALNCTVTVDQRHAPRDATCDIGAYELVQGKWSRGRK